MDLNDNRTSSMSTLWESRPWESKPWESKPWLVIAGLTVLVSIGLLAWSDGNVAVALAPTCVGLGAVALWTLPMRYIAHGILFIGLLVDNPTERPGQGFYKSPLYAAGSFLYQPLEKSIKLPGMKITGLELVLVCMALIMGWRMWVRDPIDGKHRSSAATPMMQSACMAMLTLLGMELWGLARGGGINYSILQMRTMFFMPLLTMIFAYSFKSRRDIKVLLMTYVTVGLARAFLCIFYYLTVMRSHWQAGGHEGDGSYVTMHSDSILAAAVIVICVVTLYQNPTLRSFIFAALAVPIIGTSIILNNRRIAFVAVALGCFFSYLAAKNEFRMRVHKTVLALTPILLMYMAVGWNAHGSWAKPVQSLKSVVVQKDTSSATRDIENFNLLQTLRQNPISGSGLGHPYLELVKAFDISSIFEAYRYVPHNSILWLWGAGGLIGFTLFWMFLGVGVFMAARVCKYAENTRQGMIAMTALAAVTSYSSQCFGDMGLMSWMGSLLVASTLGMTASLAVKIGAWSEGPEGVHPSAGGSSKPGLPSLQRFPEAAPVCVASAQMSYRIPQGQLPEGWLP